MTEVTPLAAVVLAHGDVSPGVVQRLVTAASDAGAAPVVVVLSTGADAPANARIARVRDGAPAISVLRTGMALLTNTPARLVLLLPHHADTSLVSAASLHALVEGARNTAQAVTGFTGHDLDQSPVVIARDAWLDLLTLGEQGIGAVAARRGLLTVSLEG